MFTNSYHMITFFKQTCTTRTSLLTLANPTLLLVFAIRIPHVLIDLFDDVVISMRFSRTVANLRYHVKHRTNYPCGCASRAICK